MRKIRDEALLKVLPEVLRQARARKKFSQEELADQADIDRTVISRVESGKRLPSLGVFCAIAYAVDETPEGLLGLALELLRKSAQAATD